MCRLRDSAALEPKLSGAMLSFHCMNSIKKKKRERNCDFEREDITFSRFFFMDRGYIYDEKHAMDDSSIYLKGRERPIICNYLLFHNCNFQPAHNYSKIRGFILHHVVFISCCHLAHHHYFDENYVGIL